MADAKVVLVTGGNTGLGYEVVKALAASSNPYRIIIGCRDPSKGNAAVEKVKSEVSNTNSTFSVVQVDMSSDASLDAAAQHLLSTESRIDALINNAGAQFDKEAKPGSAASLRKVFNDSWDVNVTGTTIFTSLVMPLLVKSADPRLLFLTSGAASLTETFRTDGPMFSRLNASPEAKGWPKAGGSIAGGGAPSLPSAYKSVKVGLNMVMREWARVLKADGVKVWSISPGFLATGLGGHGSENLRKMGAKEPHEGGEFIRDVIEGKHDDNVGKAIRANEVQAW